MDGGVFFILDFQAGELDFFFFRVQVGEFDVFKEGRLRGGRRKDSGYLIFVEDRGAFLGNGGFVDAILFVELVNLDGFKDFTDTAMAVAIAVKAKNAHYGQMYFVGVNGIFVESVLVKMESSRNVSVRTPSRMGILFSGECWLAGER